MTKILLIEDEAHLRDFISSTLELFGYEVITAENGEKGVELAVVQAPDIVLCDISLPGIDGYGVLSMLRSKPSTVGIPLIFLTARTDRQEVRKGMALGADDYITKPFGVDELLSSINARLLRKEDSNREVESIRQNLTTSIPHEFITPLNSVLGFCQLILWTLEEGEQIPPNELEEYVRQIQEGGKRLLQLTQNYILHAELNVLATKPEKERFPSNEESSISKEAILGFLSSLSQYKERKNDIIIDVEPALLPISESHLKKLITELISNAMKFSTFNTPIYINGCVDKEQNKYVLTFSDEGRGMSESQIKKVGAFMQFERSKYEQQGAGLGLILCKQIAELRGGALSIESQPDYGTKIIVALPLSVT